MSVPKPLNPITSRASGAGLINSVDLPIIVVDRDLAVASFNAAAATLLSLTTTNVGRPLRGIRMLADITELEERCAHAIGDGASYQREVLDGAGSWFFLRIAPHTENAQITGAVLTLTNVTAFRASLEQAISEREYTKAIINTLIDPVVVLDEDYRVQTANLSFYTLFQLLREQAQGVRIYELGNRDWDISRLLRFLKDTQTNNQSDALEFEHEFPAIGRRTVLLNARRLSREGRFRQMILLTIQDITERKQDEKALRGAEQELRDFVENASVGMHWVAPDGIILWANQTELKMLGYTNEEYIGHHINEFHADRPVIEEMLERLTHGQTLHEYGARLRRKDGSILDVLINSNVLWENGEFIHARCFTRDITERKRAEDKVARLNEELEGRVLERTQELEEANAALTRQAEELLRSNAELERFAYISSHDLQEPLRTITDFSQLLAKRYRGKLDAEANEFIGFVVDSCNRMQQLIKDLLAYSRVSAREKRIEEVDFEVLWRRAKADLQTEIDNRRATLTSDPLPTVTGDPVQLGQVLQNVLVNALKFSGPEQPRIHVSAKLTPADPPASNGMSEWVFSVSDNGIGIEPQYAERIFVLFQRLHGREEYPGTGIGLAICKRVVEVHGGRIWVESKVGMGSTFYFTIPHVKETPTAF